MGNTWHILLTVTKTPTSLLVGRNSNKSFRHHFARSLAPLTVLPTRFARREIHMHGKRSLTVRVRLCALLHHNTNPILRFLATWAAEMVPTQEHTNSKKSGWTHKV